MAVTTGDLTLQRAIELSKVSDGVERLLELSEGSRGAIHQARGRCLAALQERPTNRRELLQALELIDHALDDLDNG
jgi:hypothetical protein